jgi:hypothetical protein
MEMDKVKKSEGNPMLSNSGVSMVVASVKKAADSLGIILGPKVYFAGSATISCDGIDAGDSIEVALRAKRMLIESEEYSYGIWYDNESNRIVIGTRKEEFERECKHRDR